MCIFIHLYSAVTQKPKVQTNMLSYNNNNAYKATENKKNSFK